jgi:hypothetical protein
LSNYFSDLPSKADIQSILNAEIWKEKREKRERRAEGGGKGFADGGSTPVKSVPVK